MANYNKNLIKNWAKCITKKKHWLKDDIIGCNWWKAELNTKISSIQQLCSRVVEFLVFNPIQ